MFASYQGILRILTTVLNFSMSHTSTALFMTVVQVHQRRLDGKFAVSRATNSFYDDSLLAVLHQMHKMLYDTLVHSHKLVGELQPDLDVRMPNLFSYLDDNKVASLFCPSREGILQVVTFALGVTFRLLDSGNSH